MVARIVVAMAVGVCGHIARMVGIQNKVSAIATLVSSGPSPEYGSVHVYLSLLHMSRCLSSKRF